MRLILTLACLGLAACTGGKPITVDGTPLQAPRFWANAVQDQPFDTGPVTIIASERGLLRSYTLVPCRGGDAVCGGSLNGPVAQVTVAPDFDIIAGAYPGRVFYLSPGGDGIMKIGRQSIPVAWEDENPVPRLAVTRR